MPRKPRIHYPGAFYHVILRGNDRQTIFFDVNDRCRFYLLLQEMTERHRCRVHAFCLMTNHLHLAIQVSDVPLHRIMHALTFRYTRWINHRQDRVGHLFQGRYRAILIDADAYLLELVRYIHLNPVRAGMVDDPADYPWSGHRSLLGQEVLHWMTSDWLLGLFGTNVPKARHAYHQFVAEGLTEGYRKEFHEGGEVNRGLLGNERFVDQVLQADIVCRRQVNLTVADIVAAVSHSYGVEAHQLATPGKSRQMAEARAIAACLVQELAGLTLVELGHFLQRDVSSLSSAAQRLSAKVHSEETLKQRLVEVRQSLG